MNPGKGALGSIEPVTYLQHKRAETGFVEAGARLGRAWNEAFRYVLIIRRVNSGLVREVHQRAPWPHPEITACSQRDVLYAKQKHETRVIFTPRGAARQHKYVPASTPPGHSRATDRTRMALCRPTCFHPLAFLLAFSLAFVGRICWEQQALEIFWRRSWVDEKILNIYCMWF